MDKGLTFLNLLAIKFGTWREASLALCTAVHGELLLSILGDGKFENKYAPITEDDWLKERERLVNKSSWADAPEEAICQAMDESGQWNFFSVMPFAEGDALGIEKGQWYFDSDDASIVRSWNGNKAISIPVGFNWEDTLEERPE